MTKSLEKHVQEQQEMIEQLEKYGIYNLDELKEFFKMIENVANRMLVIQDEMSEFTTLVNEHISTVKKYQETIHSILNQL